VSADPGAFDRAAALGPIDPTKAIGAAFADARLDLCMANAWPAVEVTHSGDWWFRWSEGVTRRANSVLARGDQGGVEALVGAAQRFYAERNAPALFLLSTASAPSSLASLLIDRGYGAEARTLMVRATTGDVIARTVRGDWSVTVAERVSDAWFAAYWSVEAARGRTERHAEICRTSLLAPRSPSRFVAVHERGEVIACGEVVVDGSWAGVQCMATRPSARRRGAAVAVLHRLADEAHELGARSLYLAVMADNAPALALYGRAGFRPTHEYCYYVRSSAGR